MDASHECEASRSILRRKGISFASEWTETLVRRFYEIDKELKRPVHIDDEEIIEKIKKKVQGVEEEETDQVKALKKQLAEMKELSKQLMGGSDATSKANKPVSDALKTSKSKEDDKSTSEMQKTKGSKSEATKGRGNRILTQKELQPKRNHQQAKVRAVLSNKDVPAETAETILSKNDAPTTKS